jgi:hypothetical protein
VLWFDGHDASAVSDEVWTSVARITIERIVIRSLIIYPI